MIHRCLSTIGGSDDVRADGRRHNPRKALRERNEKDIIRKHIASAMQRLLLRVRNGRYDRSNHAINQFVIQLIDQSCNLSIGPQNQLISPQY